MKIYKVQYGKRSNEHFLTASEDYLFHAVNFYRETMNFEPKIEVFEVKTRGKNFNSFGLPKEYKLPF